MDFYEVLDQVIDLLQSRQRVAYRALKRQFDFDDDDIEALKDELIDAQRVAVDEEGKVLVWTGEARPTSSSASSQASVAGPEPARPQEREPLSYTPSHLVEKILTSHAALHGERKQVTVLFCDLANSTSLAEQIGPETMHTVLNQFFELALGAIHRYEGTINQFLGDGFMALFGAPIAHEDHARRAILAGLEFRRALYAYNAGQHRPRGIELTIRMGLNTGMVVVGAIGDNLRMDYTAVGDTTNMAARLEQEAAPNQMVISEATHRLVTGYCTTRSLGTFALKGKTEPMAAWEVISAQQTRTRLEVEAERGLTPFVGRGRDLRTLHDCFAQAQVGQGQVVLLVGEAGIGKSRLLLEFRRQLSETEATWLEGHALSFGQSMAFHPLVDLLKRNFRIEEGDTEPTIIEKVERGVLLLGEELRPILPYLRHLLAVDPGDEAVRTMDPRLRRGELFVALRRLLLRAAEVRPQVVVFEDLHWMDQATEALLVATADSIPTSRILWLCTYRPGYQHPFGDRTYHTRMALSNLSAADSVQMVQAMLDSVRLPEALETLIAQKAEGNPFFVEEIVKSLQEVGAIRREGNRYVLARALDDIVVPDTIQDVLMARIDRLEESPKQTLQLAAVIGREFTYRLLDRLADLQDHTETDLQALKALELIYEQRLVPELSYMFKHALTLDVAYNSLLMQRRQELHRLIGQAIEDLYADRLAEQFEVLAHHFAQGEEWAKALEYFRRAADKAAQAFATREAIALYDQALEVTGHLGEAVDPKTVMAIHQAKADLYFVLSDFERAGAEGERLLSLAEQVGDRVSAGAALAAMGHASFWAHNFDQALTYTHQAIEIAEEADARAVLAASHFTICWVHSATGQLDQAQEAVEHALALSRSVGDAHHQSLSLGRAGQLRSWEGEYVEAARLQSEGLRVAREHNLLVPLQNNYFWYGLTLTGKGDYDEALATFEDGLALSEKMGNEVQRLRLLNSLGWLYSELGMMDRALDFNLRGAEGARQRGNPETIANAELNLGDLFLAQGDLAQAQAYLDGIHRLVNDPATSDWNKWRYSTHLFASLGELWLARGDDRQAQEFAEQCLELATRSNSRKYVVKGWRLKGAIALARGHWDEAGGMLRQALTIAESIGNPPQLWKTHLTLGRLHAAVKRSEQARQAYRAACDVIDKARANLHNPDLRMSFDNSPQIKQIYDLSCELGGA